MTEFMPQDRLPIHRMAQLRRGTVGGDHAPEANAQVAGIARHSEGAHREIFLFGKHFDDRRRLQLDTVLCAKIAFCLPE